MTHTQRQARTIAVAVFIIQGNTPNITLLAKHFHCSTRTIYRDIASTKAILNSLKEPITSLFNPHLL